MPSQDPMYSLTVSGVVSFCILLGTILGTMEEDGQTMVLFFKAINDIIIDIITAIMWSVLEHKTTPAVVRCGLFARHACAYNHSHAEEGGGKGAHAPWIWMFVKFRSINQTAEFVGPLWKWIWI